MNRQERPGGIIVTIPAAVGAFLATFAVSAGETPARIATAVGGPSVSSLVVFAVMTAGGLWVLGRADAGMWRWAVPVGLILATADLMGIGLAHFDSLVHPLLVTYRVWAAVHWLGMAWMAILGVAALLIAADAHRDRAAAGSSIALRPPHRWGIGRLHAAVSASDRRTRMRGALVLGGLFVVAELPYLIIYWPGIVLFDTYRSLAYARGISSWSTYEPVGHSILIAIMDWSGHAMHLGDAGTIAIGSIAQIVTGAAALSFMMTRIAVWGLGRRAWTALVAWLALLPMFGLFAVTVVKDPPFTSGMLVFLTCAGELAFGPDRRRRWVWVTLAASGMFAIVTRNNGVYALLLGVPLMILVLRPVWKRLLVLLGVLVAGYALYAGPVYWVLNVHPGPAEEAFSIPIQQLARIAKDDGAHLSASDRRVIAEVFDGASPTNLGKHYVPGLADPMKLQARKAWTKHTLSSFLVGWARVAAHHPATAIEATLANTLGYWSPTGTSYDGIITQSFNNVRTIHLQIPSGPAPAGSAAAIINTDFLPSHDYWVGLRDDGYLAIPLLGLAMSPGPLSWAWLLALVLVMRRRDVRALAVFVPTATLMLTVIAGPVSGGQRYSLVLFMALPLAAASALLARRADRGVTHDHAPHPGLESSGAAAHHPT